MCEHNGTNRRLWAASALALLGLVIAAAVPAAADDRDLLRKSAGKPYVFIIFDTSGSMHWSPKCTQEQFDAGTCDFLCPSGDCYVPLNSDDEASKFFQAKAALYEVLEQVSDVDFGFATYNQDLLYLRSKHWLYTAAADGVTISGFGAYPATGTQEVFGLQWTCDSGNGDENIGCAPGDPADLESSWERERMQRLPKGGLDFNTVRTFYVRVADTTTYRVRYTPVSGVLGDPTVVTHVRVDRCNNGSCSSRTLIDETDVTYTRVGEFNAWDAGTERSAAQKGYFAQCVPNSDPCIPVAADSPADNTCSGWDPNNDNSADTIDGHTIRFPTVTNPLSSLLNEGDVVPLTWEADNQAEILERLAPNIAVGESIPDFRTARYFENLPDGNHLHLVDEDARPLVAYGSTPLGNSIKSFRTWYAGCAQGSCPNNSGWKDLAAANDPDWGCRTKYLIVLTDGDETCGGGNSACNGTAALQAQEGVKTFVVAFGVQGGSNVLTCMANNGGTGEPIFPQNKEELVAALNSLFAEIREETRAFASAAVPSVQAQVADKIYLTNFTPLNPPKPGDPPGDSSVWSGHLDAYLKPLPLTADKRPDRSRSCGGTLESSCHAWDAGEKLLLQAPTAAQVAADVYEIGDQPLERRVYYPKAALGAAVPRTLQLFTPPSSVADQWDLWNGMGIPFVPIVSDPNTAAVQEARDVIRFTLRVKTATIDKPDGTQEDITYVLGDIFHSNPRVLSSPDRFRYFAADLFGNGKACDDAIDPNPGYQCFFRKHEWRRKVVVVGSNDGQLHAFDAGIFDGDVVDGRVDGLFDNGSGHELFSLIPRLALPTVRKVAQQSSQEWSIDGTVQLDDFFMDPVHNGIPTVSEREWRTVILTGMREGGRGYIAVDVTQPDKFESEEFHIPDTGGNYVPSCLKSYTAAACGPLPYPSVLWEFTDNIVPDEDQNSRADLGETWSIPNTGRLRVIENGAPVDKFVAVFGGGMDPQKSNVVGDWLYIVDIETGDVLYKRQLDGSAPSEPAAVDTDQDSYIDTIYIGTTEGFLYKVDVRTPQPITNVQIPPLPGGVFVDRITAPEWQPFKIFDTGGRPIYFPPAVVYVGQLQKYALAFGSGDREDLWATPGQEGRFYLILDAAYTPTSTGLPLTEANYQMISPTGGEDSGTDVLFTPQAGKLNGWVMRLDADERVITKGFSLSGITVFTAYSPQTVVTGGQGQTNPLCSRTGTSRIFTVFTTSANAVIDLDGEGLTRFWEVPEFVTDPYTEQSATKNPPANGGGTAPPHSDQLTDNLTRVMETLKGLFPDNCRFANYTTNIKTIRSDTGVVFIAPVPICIVERNWKEF